MSRDGIGRRYFEANIRFFWFKGSQLGPEVDSANVYACRSRVFFEGIQVTHYLFVADLKDMCLL